MCILTDIKQAYEKHDLNVLREKVDTLRSAGYRYEAIATIFRQQLYLNAEAFEDLMQELDSL